MPLSKFKVYEEPDYVEKYLSRVGHPISQQWGYIAERLFGDDAEVANLVAAGLWRIQSRRHQIPRRERRRADHHARQGAYRLPHHAGDRVWLRFFHGVQNFDVSAFFQGLARESFWLDADSTAPFVNNRALLQAYADDHWSESEPRPLRHLAAPQLQAHCEQ